jgi:hypothetical protein
MNGLEALDYLLDKQEKLEKYGTSGTISVSKQRECLNAIEKELKVLNMVRRNRIVIYDKQTFIKHINAYCEDIIAFHIPHGKDEFDLLREVLL